MNRILIIVVLLVGVYTTSAQAPTKPITPIIKKAVIKKVPVKWLMGKATAYYNGHDRMNGHGRTASGYHLSRGITYKGHYIVASDKKIPIGTLILVKLSDGTLHKCVVLDRGGNIKGNHFDIVLSNRNACKNFGVQKMQYRIIGRMVINEYHK